MSMKMIRRVWKDAQVSGRPLTLLLALASRANDKGEVAVSLKELRQQARLNEEQARGGIEQLVTTKHMMVTWPADGQSALQIHLFPGKGWAVQGRM
jgi:hypothetical protein